MSDDVMIARPRRERAGFARRWRSTSLTGGGTDGNEKLTAVNGAILIILLAVIGFTIPQLRQFIWLHLFMGLLLIGPVVLKMASTGYRFVRYYTHDSEYERKGPPEIVLRVIAPLVVVSTVGVFVTGIALLIVGPAHRDPWLLLHKVTFIVWIVFTSLHILGHLPAVARALGFAGRAQMQGLGAAGGATGRWIAGGATGRWIALTGALLGGLVLAVVLIPSFASWTAHSVFLHHHHH